jgi:hypothetical protein
MPSSYRVVTSVVAAVLTSTIALAEGYDARPGWEKAAYTTYAAAADVVPVVSATVAPRCLPGYFACKISFAAVGLITAAEQLLASGGSDLAQTRALLHRGFGGDWVLTGPHAAGDRVADPLPDPLPVASPEAAPAE